MITKMGDTLTQREILILSLLYQGKSAAYIGRFLGLSRERIRQIAKKFGLSCQIIPLGYSSIKEYAQNHNYSTRAILNLISKGRLDSLKFGNHRIIKFNEVPKVRLKLCELCGKPLPKLKIRYCSNTCYELGHIKATKRYQWRKFYKKKGLKLQASLQLLRDRKVGKGQS